MSDFNDLPKSVSNVARDAAYVVVGLGVLGLQRAQVQRQAIQRSLAGSDLDQVVGTLRSNVGRGVRELDDAVEQGFRHVEAAVKPIEDQLPDPVRDVVAQGRHQARELRGQIRQLVHAAV